MHHYSLTDQPVSLIQCLPQSHVERPRHETPFRKISPRPATCLPSGGTWHRSLLDPDPAPCKNSGGSSFMGFSLAWSMNHGLRDIGTERSHGPTAPVVMRQTMLMGHSAPMPLTLDPETRR
jgi:hypothetical protein